MPVFFLLVLILIVLIRYQGKRIDKEDKQSSEDFWKAELAASYTRKQDISGLPYINLPEELINSLPDIADPLYHKYLEDLEGLSGKSILRLTGITNTELKQRYGMGNFTFLAECDENYDKLYQTFRLMAGLLTENGYTTDAERILAYLSSLEDTEEHT